MAKQLEGVFSLKKKKRNNAQVSTETKVHSVLSWLLHLDVSNMVSREGRKHVKHYCLK